MSLTFDIVQGDIAQVPADALITAIGSSGQWYGGVDNAIKAVAGEMFHHQATMALPFGDRRALLATGGPANRGKFKNVLFVVDDLNRPLNEIVMRALRAADAFQMSTVTLPAIRTGHALGEYEPTAQLAVQRLIQGLRDFKVSNPRKVRSVRFVIYNDPQTVSLLTQGLKQIEG